MSTLTVTRGCPGSGKDTWAADVQAERPGGVVVVNRDATRKRLFGSDGPEFYNVDKDNLYRKEKLVTQACHTEITEALKAGFDVICSDTNLPVRRCRELRALAKRAGADFEVNDSFASVPLEVCLERNAARERSVPEEVIRSMYDRFIRGGLAPLPDEETQVMDEMIPESGEDRPGMKTAYIFDIDGTLAHIPEGGRSPYDYSRVGEDVLDESVADVLDALNRTNSWIFLVSGRKSECRKETEDWLDYHGVEHDGLFMRADGDDRADWKVKYDLFDTLIRPRYRVLGVFDDRVQVLRMWEQIGLKTFRVGGLEGGNF